MIEKTYPITEQLLSKVLILSHKLLRILSQEEGNLKSKAAPESLSDIANNKKEIVSQLEQFSKQLSHLLATENLSLNQEGIKEYFQKARTSGFQITNTFAQWQQITAITEKCRYLNEQNGASIGLLIRHNQRSLQILRGKSQLSATYGPDGSTTTEQFSHSLVSV